jgi:hypothetical protein
MGGTGGPASRSEHRWWWPMVCPVAANGASGRRRTGRSPPASGSTRRMALRREDRHQVVGHALDSGVGLEVHGFLDGFESETANWATLVAGQTPGWLSR